MQSTSEPKIQTRSTFSAALVIDGVSIDVRVKRMTNAEYAAFAARFARYAQEHPEASDDLDAQVQREQQAAAWMREVLRDYLTILPNQLQHDGREVLDGAELLDIYGGRGEIALQAVTIIAGENRLSDAEKNGYRSRLASQIGSASAPRPTIPGDAPASVAAPAALRASVPDAAATALDSATSSGTTGQ